MITSYYRLVNYSHGRLPEYLFHQFDGAATYRISLALVLDMSER